MKGVIPANKIQRIAREEFNTFAPVANELVLPYAVSSAIVTKYGTAHGFKPELADGTLPMIQLNTNVDLKRSLLPSPEVHAKLPPRLPVVTVMGHVDHGKTTLLDSLRGANVAAQEAGGITQSVSAFKVPFGDRPLTFLDTPGHGAFHIMRETGSGVADIVLLVVALDEGVKPQTKESVGMAVAAKTPILAAINKIDLGGDVKKLRTWLKRLVPATLLLDTVEVSAKRRTNLDALRTAILAASTRLDPRADLTAPVEGTVIEAVVDRSKGHMVRGVLHRGTLEVGQHLVAGLDSGRVRALYNDRGEPITRALPGEPVQIAGLGGTPLPGEGFFAIARNRIEEIVEYRKLVLRFQEQQQWAEQQMQEQAEAVAGVEEEPDTRSPGAKKEQRKVEMRRDGGRIKHRKDEDEEVEEKDGDEDEGAGIRVPVVVKAGNVGGLVMLLDSLHKMSDMDVNLAVVQASVGTLKPMDIAHAEAEGAGNCPILCFDGQVSKELLADAKARGVEVKLYSVVFDLLDDVKARIMRKVKEYEDKIDEEDDD